MLDDTLVESFEACGQQGEPLLAGELFDDVLRQLPALRCQRITFGGAECGFERNVVTPAISAEHERPRP